MKNRRISMLLLAILTLFAVGASAQYPYSGSKIPADNNYKIGKLDNGLTYYIRRATNPADHAEFFIIHNVGSLQENDDQRGLAHFLEHMAFNGTKHFPDKLLLEYFAGVGVKFGANINAYTSMDRTVYNISAVPVKIRSTIIDSALLALHDWSHYISCEPEEIEMERGVVREEWRRGDDARSRMMKGINRFVQQGSKFAERDVIGLMSVIDNFSRETLIDYYHKWYRPDLQAVVVVGDIDVADIEKRIIERFSTIPGSKGGAVRESYSIPDNKKPIIGFLTDPESAAVSVRLVVKIPNLTPEQKESYLAAHEEVVSSLFMEMLKERIASATSDPESESKALVPVFGISNYAATTFTITALPKESKNTIGALKGIAIETERIKQHGFSQEELDRAKVLTKRALESSKKRVNSYKNSDYVAEVVENFTRSTPLYNHNEYYKIAQEILSNIKVEDLNRASQRYLTDENRVIVFSVPESDKEYLPTKEEVLALFDNVKSSELERFKLSQAKELDQPQNLKVVAPKKIKKVTSSTYNIKYHKELDSTTQWELANGIKIIWKEEFGKQNGVQMRAFRNGGFASNESAEDLKLLENFILNLTVNGMNRGELTKWSSNHKLSIRPQLGYRTSDISGSFNAKEADNFFALLYHLFNSVTIDQSDVDSYKERAIKALNKNMSENNRFKDSVTTLRYSSNPLKRSYSQAYIESISSQKITDLFYRVLANPKGYTFIFSGALSAQQGQELTSKYLSTLTTKGAGKEKFTYREPRLREGEVSLRYLAKGMLSTKASVERVYHSPVEYSAKNNMMAKYLTYILRERYMKSIREEKGGTYYVGVTSDITRYPAPTIIYSIAFDTDPALVDELLEIVQLEIDKMVDQGPLEREIRETTLYLKKVLNEREEKIDWPTIIYNGILGNKDLNQDEQEYINNMNAQELHQFARKIFNNKNRMTFIFEPLLK